MQLEEGNKALTLLFGSDISIIRLAFHASEKAYTISISFTLSAINIS